MSAEPLAVGLGRGPTVADALRAVSGERRPFALTGRWAGSRAIVGSDPVRVVEGAEVLEVLGAQQPHEIGGAVGGGWFGCLGFPLAAALERLPP